MDREKLLEILQLVSRGETSPDAALSQLRNLPFEDIGFAKVDLHRSLRQGMPEVIYCPGKTSEHIAEIALKLRQHHSLVLASRATPEQSKKVLELVNNAGVYHELPRMLIFGDLPAPDETAPAVAIATAGTADIPVAEEAAIILQSAAIPVLRVNDVGVAGLHRLLANLEILRTAAAVIVVAGMDGALPSVVAGLLDQPVIAVPTSVGYGASLQGLAPLLTMLNSCAAGLTVVNIDNGFGAAMAAFRVLQQIKQRQMAIKIEQ